MKWDDRKAQLLEGLSGTSRQVTSQILENLRTESKKANSQQQLTETAPASAVNTGQFSRYDRLFMPLVRRVTPALIAMDIVGNQPLNGPVGMVRTLRRRYNSDVAAGSGTTSVTAGTEANGMRVYEKYSSIALGDTYDVSYADNQAQTYSLESQAGNAMSLDIVKQTVTAKTRKLHAEWSIEADQDAQSLDGIDLEQEMISSLADEIQRELNLELITKLRNLAGTARSFDFANADGRYAGEKFTAITVGMSNLSNQISQKTKRGGGTWTVVSPNVLTALRNASNGSFQPAYQGGDFSAQNSLMVGVLNGQTKVYVDLYDDSGQPLYAQGAAGDSTGSILMGYKGASELDSGMVYAPYVNIQSSGVVTDPTTFDARLSLMTRYDFVTFTDAATSLANSANFYAKASVNNLALGF